MGLLTRDQTEGEGMNIIGRRHNIIITIETILERENNKSRVKLRVDGVPKISGLVVAAHQNLTPLVDGITVGVSPVINRPNYVRMIYGAPNEYKLERMEYDKY